MNENRIKNENYILIQGWMITELKLKGNELLIYAIIYGFSQAENQVFNGSLQYLAEWTNSTKQGVIKCLKSLVDKGYIEKEDKYINNVKFCEYYATKFNRVLNKVEQGSKQSLTNNININTCSSYNNKETFEIFEENLGRPLSPIEYEKIKEWEKDINRELIEYALKTAILNNKKSLNYIGAILRNWKTAGYKTKQDVIDDTKTKISPEESNIEVFEYDWLNDE